MQKQMNMFVGLPQTGKYRGHVNYLGDLDGIQASFGDVYSVTYMGHHYDPPELRKRIEANVCYCDGWQIMTGLNMEDIEYMVVTIYKEGRYTPFDNDFEVDTIAAKVEINYTQGIVRITDLWPVVLDISEKKIELLPDVLAIIKEDNNVRRCKDDISATMEFAKVVSDIKIAKNMDAY